MMSFLSQLPYQFATSAFVAQESTKTFWMPEKASTFADDVDGPFYFIYWVCLFFFVLIVALMVWFMWRYRRPAEGTTPDTHAAPTHNTPLEVTWSAIPLVLVIVMFYLGFRGALNMQEAPDGAMTIDVVAQKWSWSFKYSNGWQDNVLHVPADEPVRLLMTSKDVIHSLFVPAFRVKRDVVPGKFSEIWFEVPSVALDGQAERSFHLFCTEYCGTEHSKMTTTVVVHATRADYERWLADVSNLSTMPRHVAGEKLYNVRGCAGCHSADGSDMTGPTFKNIWSRTVNGETKFADGSNLASLLDSEYGGMPENYLIESIWEPQKRIVQGRSNAMPTFQGQIDEEEMGYLIAYFKWLEDNTPPPTAMELWEQAGKPAPGEAGDDAAAGNGE